MALRNTIFNEYARSSNEDGESGLEEFHEALQTDEAGIIAMLRAKLMARKEDYLWLPISRTLITSSQFTFQNQTAVKNLAKEIVETSRRTDRPSVMIVSAETLHEKCDILRSICHGMGINADDKISRMASIIPQFASRQLSDIIVCEPGLIAKVTTDKTEESSCTMECFGVHHKISLLMNSQQLSFLDAMSGIIHSLNNTEGVSENIAKQTSDLVEAIKMLLGDPQLCQIADDLQLGLVANCLGVLQEELRTSLTTKVLRITRRCEDIGIPLQEQQMLLRQHSLALYLNDLIVNYFMKEVNNLRADYIEAKRVNHFVRLDIIFLPGYDKQDVLTLDSLLKNYAREKIDRCALAHSLELDSNETAAQLPRQETLKDFDNSLNALEGRDGILTTLGEVSMGPLPSAPADANLRAHQRSLSTGVTLAGRNDFKMTRNQQSKNFAIMHSCGTVNYSIEGWVQANRTCDHATFQYVMQHTTSPFLSLLRDTAIDHQARYQDEQVSHDGNKVLAGERLLVSMHLKDVKSICSSIITTASEMWRIINVPLNNASRSDQRNRHLSPQVLLSLVNQNNHCCFPQQRRLTSNLTEGTLGYPLTSSSQLAVTQAIASPTYFQFSGDLTPRYEKTLQHDTQRFWYSFQHLWNIITVSTADIVTRAIVEPADFPNVILSKKNIGSSITAILTTVFDSSGIFRNSLQIVLLNYSAYARKYLLREKGRNFVAQYLECRDVLRLSRTDEVRENTVVRYRFKSERAQRNWDRALDRLLYIMMIILLMLF